MTVAAKAMTDSSHTPHVLSFHPSASVTLRAAVVVVTDTVSEASPVPPRPSSTRPSLALP